MKKNQRKKTPDPRPETPVRREVPRVSPDPEEGLTQEQAHQREQAGWANTPVESPTKSVGEIVRANVCTFFNFIFIVLACLLITVGSFDDMLFLLIAAANTGIGIIQQLRSKATIDKLNLLSAPRAKVVREGNLISIPSAHLVRDDVAEFTSGDQIPADATVLSGSAQVNEALITGEADAIEKGAGDTLLSGSFVVAGKCRARLDKVGADSYAARLTLGGQEERHRRQIGDDGLSGQADPGDRHSAHPRGCGPVYQGVLFSGAGCAAGRGVHGGRPDRHDSGGAVSAHQRGPGGEPGAPGPGQGAGPGYELY